MGWGDTWQGGGGEEWEEKKDVLGESSATEQRQGLLKTLPLEPG